MLKTTPESSLELTLELGFNMVWNFADWKEKPSNNEHDEQLKRWKKYKEAETAYPVDAVRNLKQLFADKGILLNVILYEGIGSPWSAGKPCNKDISKFKEMVNIANQAGAAFMLALNGGLIDHGEPEPIITDALRHLEDNNQMFPWGNKVTVMHDRMYDLAKQVAPSLDVIASCIKHLDPNCSESYSDMFEKFDYVVPLNQHTTYEFLSQHREHASDMMLFLNQGCGGADLYECYAHFLQYECMQVLQTTSLDGSEEYMRGIVMPRSQYPVKVPSQVSTGGKCWAWMLYEQPEQLAKLVQMGCTNFKVPRDTTFNMRMAESLVTAHTQSN